MQSGLAFDGSAQLQEGREDKLGLLGWPLTHAAAGKEMWMLAGFVSPCSRRSAMTRKARVSAFTMASSFVVPYVRTPGSSMTSASDRPSSSCSHSIV